MVGVAYTLFARAMYRQQLAALQRELQREQHAALPVSALPLPPPGDTPRCGTFLFVSFWGFFLVPFFSSSRVW